MYWETQCFKMFLFSFHQKSYSASCYIQKKLPPSVIMLLNSCHRQRWQLSGWVTADIECQHSFWQHIPLINSELMPSTFKIRVMLWTSHGFYLAIWAFSFGNHSTPLYCNWKWKRRATPGRHEFATTSKAEQIIIVANCRWLELPASGPTPIYANPNTFAWGRA